MQLKPLNAAETGNTLCASGVLALPEPKVRDALTLNESDQSKLREFADEYLKARDHVLGERQDLKKLQAFDNAEMDKARSVLSNAQSTKWNAIRGERPAY